MTNEEIHRREALPRESSATAVRGQNRFEESIIPILPIEAAGEPVSREAVGGRLMESLSKRQSHKCKSSIHHPIRRLRRHLPYLGKADHQAAGGRLDPIPCSLAIIILFIFCCYSGETFRLVRPLTGCAGAPLSRGAFPRTLRPLISFTV